MALKMKITYSTMSADNEELQSAFDAAFAKVRQSMLGLEVPMFIDGEKVYAEEKTKACSPVDTSLHLCTAQKGTAEHARMAVAAARAAAKGWAATPWQERVAVLRKVAQTIRDRNFELSAVMVLEVGKSRLEALGEVEETADLVDYYANAMEKNRGYINALGKMNPDDPQESNMSVLKPFGVWVVISPFNFPMALSGAPIAAALVTGNTVVFKGASTTLYTGWLTAQLFADAGLPPGVFNYVSGPGRTVGQELQDNPEIDGWTFTGSYDVGMQVARNALSGRYPRPAIIEMGGKNPTVISNKANLEKAVQGVVRSAFGLDGQKCSACSRVYVHKDVYDDFVGKLVAATSKLKVGDPSTREAFMGTVIDKGAYDGLPEVHRPGAPGWAGAIWRQHGDGRRLCQGLLRAAGHRCRAAGRSSAGEERAVPADPACGQGRQRGRGHAPGQRHAVWVDGRLLQRGRAGGALLPGQHPGGHGLRQPCLRRDDRGVAGHPGLWRLEGFRHERQGRRRALHAAAVHARAEPDVV